MPLVSNEPAETRDVTPFHSTTRDFTDHSECSASEASHSSPGEERDCDVEPQLETEKAVLEIMYTMLTCVSHYEAHRDPTECFKQSLEESGRSPANNNLREETGPSSNHSQACQNPDSAQSCRSCSPSDVLDRYVQLATDTHLAQLDAIHSTSTANVDWTQLGGQPPAEKCNAVELLWLQLLFQKERTKIHAERYKILHEKVRKLQIQNENIATLKDQVRLLKNENDDMQNELKICLNHYQQLASDKHRAERTFNETIQRMTQEFGNLQCSNRKLQTLLVTQNQENDVLKTEAEAAQSQLVDLMLENEVMENEVRSLRNVEAEYMCFWKDNPLLYQYNLERLNYYSRADNSSDNGREIALSPEHLHLKRELEEKEDLINSLREKITALENENISLKKLAGQENLMESIKSLHENGIKVIEKHPLYLQEAQIEPGARVRDLSGEVKE